MEDLSITERKNEVRKTFLKVRKSLTRHESEELSRKIISRLLNQTVFREADTVHVYVSMEQNREVSTKDFIRDCFSEGKNIVVPKMNSGGSLTHHKIHSLDKLKPNKWGVYEPEDKNRVDPHQISLVVVPMVASDFHKNRIGYGRGYYDRFLSQTRAKRAGICYNCTLSWNMLPASSFDQPMDLIITESGILK